MSVSSSFNVNSSVTPSVSLAQASYLSSSSDGTLVISKDGKTVEIIPKPPGVVLGELVLRPLIDRTYELGCGGFSLTRRGLYAIDHLFSSIFRMPVAEAVPSPAAPSSSELCELDGSHQQFQSDIGFVKDQSNPSGYGQLVAQLTGAQSIEIMKDPELHESYRYFIKKITNLTLFLQKEMMLWSSCQQHDIIQNCQDLHTLSMRLSETDQRSNQTLPLSQLFGGHFKIDYKKPKKLVLTLPEIIYAEDFTVSSSGNFILRLNGEKQLMPSPISGVQQDANCTAHPLFQAIIDSFLNYLTLLGAFNPISSSGKVKFTFEEFKQIFKDKTIRQQLDDQINGFEKDFGTLKENLRNRAIQNLLDRQRIPRGNIIKSLRKIYDLHKQEIESFWWYNYEIKVTKFDESSNPIGWQVKSCPTWFSSAEVVFSFELID